VQNVAPSYRKGQRITGPERVAVTSAVKTMYWAGNGIRAIACDLGRSYGFVHRILAEAEVEFRPRGGATQRKSQQAVRSPQFMEADEGQ
jgi:hypothetical protein